MSDKPGGELDGVYGAGAAGDAWFTRAESGEAGFPLGYSLDRQCGLMMAGELALMWARSGTGKSTWMLNVIARGNHIPTVVFNMEMLPLRQWEWLLCMANDLPVAARHVEEVASSGDDGSADYAAVMAARHATAAAFPFLHFVQPRKRPDVKYMVETVDRIWDATGVQPKRIFIDHLTLMRNCNGSKEAVEGVTSELHTWAQRDGIAVTAIQQTGRAGGSDGTRNDGHIPVTLSSGVYGGEADADYVYGLYQPSKDPKYASPEARASTDFQRVKGVTRFQLIKNRPYGELCDVGLELHYQAHSRRLAERGETWSPPAEIQHGG